MANIIFVCSRSLAFSLPGSFCIPCSHFAQELIWMDNLYCTGNETALHHCQFDGWKIHDCTTNEAAGAVCRTTRLVSTGGGDDIEAAASEQRSLRRAAALRLSNDQAVTPPALAAANSKLRVINKNSFQQNLNSGFAF